MLLRQQQQREEEKRQQAKKLREEDSKLDERMGKFYEMNEEEKDQLTSDQVLCLYLRSLSKKINLNFYVS